MNKLVKTIAASMVASALVMTPCWAATQAELEDAVATSEEELAALRQELTDLISDLDKCEADLVDKGEEIEDAQADLSAAKQRERVQYNAMKLRIRYMYESGGARLIQAVLNATDMADALNKVEYATDISNYDREMIIAYIETENEIAALKATLEAEQTELYEMQASYEKRQDELNTLIAEKEAEVENFNDQLAIAVQAALNSDPGLQEAINMAVQSGDISYIQNYGGGGQYSGDVLNAIIAAAQSQFGVSYGWGTQSPGNSFDCSGLVQYCYKQAGIDIPRTSGEILANGTVTNEPQPGDICWWSGHVGIYVGNGQYIDAEQDGTVVQVRDLSQRHTDPVYVRY